MPPLLLVNFPLVVPNTGRSKLERSSCIDVACNKVSFLFQDAEPPLDVVFMIRNGSYGYLLQAINFLVQHIKSPIGSFLLLCSFHTVLSSRVLPAKHFQVNSLKAAAVRSRCLRTPSPITKSLSTELFRPKSCQETRQTCTTFWSQM